MRRAGFAIKLRDFEAYERDLLPDSWKGHRQAFFRAFCQHVLVLPHFFELAIYLPRVVKLATASEDFESLSQIIMRLKVICETVEKNCSLSIKAYPDGSKPDEVEMLSRWKNQLLGSVQENIFAAFPPRLSKIGKTGWQACMADYFPLIFDIAMPWPMTIGKFQQQQARLFSYDLAHQPFRFIGLPKEMIAQRGIPAKKTIATFSDSALLLQPEVVSGVTALNGWIKLANGLPHGLLFATRPFNVAEIFILAKDPFSEATYPVLKVVVLALRGFTLDEKTPRLDKKEVLRIPDGAYSDESGQ